MLEGIMSPLHELAHIREGIPQVSPNFMKRNNRFCPRKESRKESRNTRIVGRRMDDIVFEGQKEGRYTAQYGEYISIEEWNSVDFQKSMFLFKRLAFFKFVR